VGLVMEAIRASLVQVRQGLKDAVEEQDIALFPPKMARYPIYMIMVDEFRSPIEDLIDPLQLGIRRRMERW